MKLSVLIMTYNHAPFIEQAVQSVLDQRTDFPFEILIADDCSTDGTKSIVKTFETAHAATVRVLKRERNLGMQANFIDAYSQCRGDYIATLDGDDYWTSPDKLQRQIAFLDLNPQYTFCFHNVQMLSDQQPKAEREVGAVTADRIGRTHFELDDLVKDNFVPFGSVVSRARLIPEFPSWINEIQGIDWIVGLFAARKGPFARIEGCHGVYRSHAGGAWTSLSWAKQIATVLDIYEGIRDEMPQRLWPLIDTMIHNINLRSDNIILHEKVNEFLRSEYGEEFQQLVSRNHEIEAYSRDLAEKYVNLENYTRDLQQKFVNLEICTRDLQSLVATMNDYNRKTPSANVPMQLKQLIRSVMSKWRKFMPFSLRR